MQRDYNSYDYLSVSVKSDILDSILSCYTSLGWRVVKRENDRQYYNMKYLSFVRPHCIGNKDRLQYLQVRMETALNGLSAAAVRRHSGSTLLCVFLCVLSLAAVATGLWLFYGVGQAVGFIAGIACFCLSCAAYVAAFVSVLVLRRREDNATKKLLVQKLRLIQSLIEEAQKLAPVSQGGAA